ncbi:argininosuccinate lyase [Alkalilimnicola sp. S0819]|uniref:argininosuccinate lyase n=1 Tax=Alkalilimnicola sp. S0819 TaxID=2613922 RepID=UPI001261DE1E|nr:argininosuccinate lyase [Alkalilimnicola sp. S0819]KAB7622701.1 argininosuccinate lyase [Alkalilimnicola sp. S0819]MPQ17340.1 argininosuccinate lyase [Alkalilimnicola sp. S0819]
MTKKSSQLWTGRFSEATDAFVQQFTASEHFDRRLYAHDIRGSQAHARMLAKVGVLTEAERDAIIEGLDAIRAEIEAGEFPWDPALEDVHMNIEKRLTDRIGEAGKKLHTGRSRNDQVATDIRLYLRDAIAEIRHQLIRLQRGLVSLAEREAATIMPGFTHLQVAQPITFGHHMLAWYEMLVRDQGRLEDCAARMNVMPLGSAALAGTSYPIERAMTCEELGFDYPSRNSLDAVSDRDFAIEFSAAGAIITTHLSRMAEEMIIWASPLTGFIELPDRFCTGSSIMPQKKNPDVAEIVRGKSARMNGHLMALLTLMKSQPLAYNRDNQEDKEPLFDAVDTVRDSLTAFADMIPNLTVNHARLYETARAGFSTATDLADYLVRQGVPFRDAHEIVGRSVRYATEEGKDLGELELDELRQFSARIGEDVFEVLTLEGSVNARDHVGGTAPTQVRAQVEAAKARLAAL